MTEPQTVSPLEQYQRDLQMDGFVYDPVQEATVKKLQRVYEALIEQPIAPDNLVDRFKALFSRPKIELVSGLYMWGGVGRGKTYLMDLFYESLPFKEKKRLHFHRFMRLVHKELVELEGEADPLKKIADRFVAQTRVLCFDEFFVSDITDAMLLGTLLTELFERGVTLIATSNIDPDNLYKDGLQRDRFLPAIDQIKRHVTVVEVDGGTDYRLRTLEKLELYHSPLGDEAWATLEQSFKELIPEEAEVRQDVDLDVESRQIRCIKVADDAVWFDFYALCDGPRSQNDYIELAREFHTVFISGLPEFDGIDDMVRRFVNLVDEFYDRGVKLILSATVPLEELYLGGRLHFEFERTRSRLLEMQSQEYLALPHKP